MLATLWGGAVYVPAKEQIKYYSLRNHIEVSKGNNTSLI